MCVRQWDYEKIQKARWKLLTVKNLSNRQLCCTYINFVVVLSVLLPFLLFYFVRWMDMYTDKKRVLHSRMLDSQIPSLSKSLQNFSVTKTNVELDCIAHADILVNHKPKISNFVALLSKQNKLYTWKSLRPICNLSASGRIYMT